MIYEQEPTNMLVLSKTGDLLFTIPICAIKVGDQLAFEAGYGTNNYYDVLEVDSLLITVDNPVEKLDVIYN